MKILVTGGAGFIGSHIVDAYIKQGHELFVIDDLSTGSQRNVNPSAVFYPVDILDASVADLLKKISPDIVCHHAAQMDVRRSVSDPLFDARVNILGLLHLLERSKDLKIKKFIYASSGGAVYGDQNNFPTPEEAPTRPQSPYGVSKLTGEFYLAYYSDVFGIPYVALRYANVYGPRQSAQGEAGVVAIFISRMLQGKPVTINGDGRQTRDYVYVEDVVAANLLALEAPFSGPLNIGTGRETDVCDLVRQLCEQTKSQAPAIHGPPKTGEQRRSCLDPSRASEILKWKPRFSLSEGLARTVDYYRQANLP